jgi:hypothetical protein
VFKKAIGTWRIFKEIEPGHRFQTRYHSHRRRREQGEASQHEWMINLIGGPALIAAGFAFLLTPGPSFIIIVIGMWMLSGEFMPLARFFDRLDAGQRKLKRWVRGRWNRLSAISKALAILICVAALGYGAYYLFFGG